MDYGFLKDNNGNKIYINDNSIYHEGKNLKDVIDEKETADINYGDSENRAQRLEVLGYLQN